jgi:hypothetical protein
MAKSDENCPLVATEWSANHTYVTGNPYEAGTYIFYNGHVYKCLFLNEGIPPTNTTYWLDLGEGHLLAEEQTDWDSTGGRSFIRNKPTKTSDFANTGEDGIHPFITIEDVPDIGDIPTLTSQLTNDGDDTLNPFITLADLPYQIEIYVDVGSFPPVGQDELIYFAEYPGTFYLWNGETTSYDQITSNAFPTGLERLTEGTNTGWRLIGRNRNYYGSIGIGAVDLSYSPTDSSILGATGDYSFAVGQSARALGKGSASVGGNQNEALNDYNFIGGGSQNITSGKNSGTISGYNAIARSFCELAIGAYNTDYTPVSITAVSPTDRAFVIGAGVTGAGNTKDVFTVYKNGAVKFSVEALVNITNPVISAGFFIFNSTDSNRPYVHNGTTWKALAYTDDSVIPTLQQVQDNNHDLVDGNNYQGTGAGVSNTGLSVNALGPNAGLSNSGSFANLLGTNAGKQNSGTDLNAFGKDAAQQNRGISVNAFGSSSGYSNSGTNVNALGNLAGQLNSNDNLNALGFLAGQSNSGRNVNALGQEAGQGNAFKNVNLFGYFASADADNQTVFSKWVSGTTKYLARLSFNNITADRKYELPDASGTIALTSVATTGAVISFDVNKIYNTATTPTALDITNDLTGAKIGVVQKIYSNKSVAPTVPAGWVKLGGDYTVSVLNIIYAEWSESSRVEYWIVKG